MKTIYACVFQLGHYRFGRILLHNRAPKTTEDGLLVERQRFDVEDGPLTGT
jgi:hypothetical protein